MLSNKPIFPKILLIIILALICVVLTAVLTLFAGSFSTNVFDFSNLNLTNAIPVLVICVFVSCAIVGIAVLCLSKDILIKLKEYFSNNKEDN